MSCEDLGNVPDMKIHDTSPYTMIFHHDNGEEVGKLDWNDGTMKFEGKAEESAQHLFKFICDWCNTRATPLKQAGDVELMKAATELVASSQHDGGEWVDVRRDHWERLRDATTKQEEKK